MLELHATNINDDYGLKIYTVRNVKKENRHSVVMVDFSDIADKAGLTEVQLMKFSDFDILTKQSLYWVHLADGTRRRAIRGAAIRSLFRMIRLNGKANEMTAAAEEIIDLALTIAPKEVGAIHAGL